LNIFITGIAGFIGSTTAEKLKQLEHQVTGIDNFLLIMTWTLKGPQQRFWLVKALLY